MVVDTRKSNFGLWLSIVVMVSDVVHLILYYKMRKMSLQNATATVFYYKIHQVFYSKMQQFYLKNQQLLQNATTFLQNATFITKWDFYYKMSWYKGDEKMSWDYFKKKTKRLIWNF